MHILRPQTYDDPAHNHHHSADWRRRWLLCWPASSWWRTSEQPGGHPAYHRGDRNSAAAAEGLLSGAGSNDHRSERTPALRRPNGPYARPANLVTVLIAVRA